MKYFILSIFMFPIFATLAQGNFVAGASFNVGFPTGQFSEQAKTGIGGSLMGEYFFSNKFSTTLSVSYQNYPGDFPELAVQGQVIDASFNSIPVVAAARYYFQGGAFTTVELGCYFFRLNIETSDIYSDERYSSDYQAKFGGSLGLGYRFDLSDQSAMDLMGVYQLVEDDLNSFALRLGIMIFLDKI